MARRLIATVYVGDQAYEAGSDVPGDVAALITNPAAWAEDEPEPASPSSGPRTRRSAKASTDERGELAKLSEDELAALAEARQVDVGDKATKDELIAALTGPTG